MSTDDKVTAQKLDDVSRKIKELVGYNYAKEKNGWITFKDKRPKEKLRKYITKLAQRMTSHSKLMNTSGCNNFKDNRQILIDYYNQDGVEGIARAFFVVMTDSIAKIKVVD